MTPNIHALDRPLVAHDPEQVGVMRALAAGWVACRECGAMVDPDEARAQEGRCQGCYANHLCPDCGEYVADVTELTAGRCFACRADEDEE